MNNIQYRELPLAELDIVGPLWEMLREYHRKVSANFGDLIQQKPFSKRKEELLAGDKRLKVWTAHCDRAPEAIGYCISSLKGGQGEVDSLYINPDFRGHGIGGEFMQRSLEWFASEGIDIVTVSVLAENEEAMPFYRRWGFMPRACVLMRRAK